MIKYSGNTINEWYFNSSEVKKVYINNSVCFTKISSGGTLPYTELSYVQLSSSSSRGGIQLLNTPKEGLLVKIDFQLSGSTSSGDIQIIGQKDNQETVPFQMGFEQYSNWSYGYYDYGGARLGMFTTPSFTTRRTWLIGRISGSTSPNVVGFYCDGINSTTNVSTLSFDANRPYCIGDIKYNGSSTPILGTNNIKPMKLYSVKIYEDYGNTLVGDYIPVIRNADNVVTLYDTISDNYANPIGTVLGSS